MVRGLAASSAMLSPVVQTVLQMGFEAGLVESLVQTKYLLTGRQYTSVSDLVSDVLQAEQEDRARAPQSTGSSQWGDIMIYHPCSPNCCSFYVLERKFGSVLGRWWSYSGCSGVFVCSLQIQRWGRAPALLEWEHTRPPEKVRGQRPYGMITRLSFF